MPLLSGRGKNAIAGFLELMEALRAEAEASELKASDGSGLDVRDLGRIVGTVLDMTGYKAELEKSNDPQDGTRLDNLNELISVGHEFSQEAANQRAYIEWSEAEQQLAEGEAPVGSIQAFLERVSLVADADQIPVDQQNMVTLMTLHTAKGLSSPWCFSPDGKTGNSPHAGFGGRAS